MKSNNKVAFLCETTSWNKKQTLVVIELDQNLQTVKVGILTYMHFVYQPNFQNWHSVDLDPKFSPHTLYPTSRFVGLISKRAVQVRHYNSPRGL